jgi:cell division protein FtsW
MVIQGLFNLLICRGIRVSLRAPDSFGSYLALGLTLLIGLQACINMGVVTGMLPTKGLSLPFLSYGGSSLLVNLLAVGILLNISTQVKRPGQNGASSAPPAGRKNGLALR